MCLREQMNFLSAASLWVAEEVGDLPITQNGVNLFFQLINRRYEKPSAVFTSNKSLLDWGEFFGDHAVVVAMLDLSLIHI